jgi:hypothetical protein
VNEGSIRPINLYLTNNIHKRQTSLPPAGVENTIPESEMQQTHSFDRSATGIGDPFSLLWKKN